MFEFLIDTLEGEPLLADLENIGACYPDDDVIYVFGIPCRLSSASHVAAEQSVQGIGGLCAACGGARWTHAVRHHSFIPSANP